MLKGLARNSRFRRSSFVRRRYSRTVPCWGSTHCVRARWVWHDSDRSHYRCHEEEIPAGRRQLMFFPSSVPGIPHCLRFGCLDGVRRRLDSSYQLKSRLTAFSPSTFDTTLRQSNAPTGRVAPGSSQPDISAKPWSSARDSVTAARSLDVVVVVAVVDFDPRRVHCVQSENLVEKRRGGSKLETGGRLEALFSKNLGRFLAAVRSRIVVFTLRGERMDSLPGFKIHTLDG
jgi:hypothetical protein